MPRSHKLCNLCIGLSSGVLIATIAGSAVALPPPPAGQQPGGVQQQGVGQQQQGGQQQLPGQAGGPPPQQQVIPPVDHKPLETAIHDAKAAHLKVSKTTAELAAVTRKLQKEFESRSDVVEATAAVASTKADYDKAAAPVLASTQSSVRYSAAMEEASAAADDVDALKRNPEATPAARTAAAAKALAARNALSKMQNDALAADSTASNAKAAYTSAAAKLNELKKNFEDSLKDDPKYVEAKKNLDEAKAAATEADDKVASARKDLAVAQAAYDAAVADQKRQQAAMQAQRGR